MNSNPAHAPEIPGNPRVPESKFKPVRKANNVDAMRHIEPQPVSKLFKGSAINKANAQVGLADVLARRVQALAGMQLIPVLPF